MKRIMLAVWVAVTAATMLVIGCGGGGGAIGETCADEGLAGECADGAICGKTKTAALQCLQICVDKEDCPEGTDCEGVEDVSTKGCRPK
jgi:hypothetical protein